MKKKAKKKAIMKPFVVLATPGINGHRVAVYSTFARSKMLAIQKIMTLAAKDGLRLKRGVVREVGEPTRHWNFE